MMDTVVFCYRTVTGSYGNLASHHEESFEAWCRRFTEVGRPFSLHEPGCVQMGDF